ncbi:MAG TPA: alpha/beta hydrolase [Pseudolysinimonas sp.]|nr:alpha/beta hydrolase [Pseudolysinimonas sp.]
MNALLIHGLSSNPAGMWLFAHTLEADGWSTERVALLGHDRGEPATRYDLESYIADAHRDGPHDLVIAHSLGGAIATVLAARDPAWTRRLVLVDPVWFVPPHLLPAVAADQVAELAETADTLAQAHPRWHDHDIAAKADAISAVDPDAVARTFDVERWDLREHAAAIRTPTLILGGDPAVYTMLEPEDAHAASVASGTIDYVVIEGAGHSPHRDAADPTVAALRAWLAEH